MFLLQRFHTMKKWVWVIASAVFPIMFISMICWLVHIIQELCQPLTETYQKSLWEIKCGQWVMLTTSLPSVSQLFRKCGSLNNSQPCRPLWPITQTTLLTMLNGFRYLYFFQQSPSSSIHSQITVNFIVKKILCLLHPDFRLSQLSVCGLGFPCVSLVHKLCLYQISRH
jgi:hypothetical protein